MDSAGGGAAPGSARASLVRAGVGAEGSGGRELREDGASGPPWRRPVAALSAYAYLWTCRRVGARARTFGRPVVVNGGNVELGEDVVLDSRAGRVELVAGRRGRLAIGDGVRIGPSTRIRAVRYVEIGDRTRIGARCVISDADADDPGEGSEIWIGDGVTLGDGVRVLPGTVIGAGAVVVAGATVSGRIPAGGQVLAGADAAP